MKTSPGTTILRHRPFWFMKIIGFSPDGSVRFKMPSLALSRSVSQIFKAAAAPVAALAQPLVALALTPTRCRPSKCMARQAQDWTPLRSWCPPTGSAVWTWRFRRQQRVLFFFGVFNEETFIVWPETGGNAQATQLSNFNEGQGYIIYVVFRKPPDRNMPRKTRRHRPDAAVAAWLCFCVSLVLLGQFKLRRAYFLTSQMPLPWPCVGRPTHCLAGFR